MDVILPFTMPHQERRLCPLLCTRGQNPDVSLYNPPELILNSSHGILTVGKCRARLQYIQASVKASSLQGNKINHQKK